jgi:hypothetical protein
MLSEIMGQGDLGSTVRNPMVSKQYALWYGLLFAIAISAVAFQLALSSGRFDASVIMPAVIVAAVIPLPLIWIARKMGYPLGEPVFCSRCGTEMPMFRKPKNLKQGLWGGYECPNCGAELDPRGREVSRDATG